MKKSRFPHSLVLIFSMIIVAQLLTYVLPAGEYDREPDPSKGESFVELEGQAPLRERLAAARTERGLDHAAVAALLSVSGTTAEGWEAGPGTAKQPGPGTHIEAGAGELLQEWITTGTAPAESVIAGWQTGAPGKKRVVPGTYHRVEAGPVTPVAFLKSIPTFLTSILTGMEKAADIIFFVFIVGGVIAVLRATGAIDALIEAAIRLLGGRPIMLVAGMVTLFAIGSSTIGMAEEYMPFIPILVTMCLALKMDAIVAMGIVYIGAGVGYGCAALNPFTVMVAQNIAGLPPTSGQLFRWSMLAVCLVVGVHHIMRYAGRLKADPSRSLVGDVDYTSGFDMPEDVRMTPQRALVLGVFAAGIVAFVVGVALWDWYFTELAAVFLAIALIAALLGGLTPNRVAETFCRGAAEMTTTALLIGFARTIEVVLSDGQVIDTVIHGIASVLQGAGGYVSAVGMLGVQSVCNFFIPSGSGQAYVTMPIMAPLADVTGITRQTAVLAYQIGDGFTNMIVPTNALLMGMLGLGKIPYQRWMRFVMPLMLKLYAVAIAAVVIAVWIGYQ